MLSRTLLYEFQDIRLWGSLNSFWQSKDHIRGDQFREIGSVIRLETASSCVSEVKQYYSTIFISLYIHCIFSIVGGQIG